MVEWITFIGVVVAAVLIYRHLSRSKKTAGNKRVYICSKCGEMDCICHKSEEPKR